ncbi:hypothetical protein K7432_011425 [Basidiobolus ranarum]|uniref:Gamma-secretase subunit Aph-1 n=1 Tax=Basidiobolus ranarum TaxID=34480 RepID=A0ABR2WM89_9FUNG
MGWLSFIGCMLTAYGPPSCIFILYVARNAQLVLLMMTSAFFWLISILFTSLIWYVAKPAQSNHAVTIFYSVLLQESFRVLFYILMRRAESGLNVVSKNPKSPLNKHSYAFVTGLGFGWVSGLVSYITLLAEALGPGMLPCISCPSVSLYFVSAIITALFTLLHITWMMLTFEGLVGSKSSYLFIWVIITHFGASYGTLLNSSNIPNGCVYSILIALIFLIVNTILVIRNLSRMSAQP